MEIGLNKIDELEQSVGKRGKSLTEQAYAILRDRVIVGELAPGVEVSEPELAEQLQMSKTPVREALARLCVEGFMEAFPRRGYRVTPVTVKDMNHLFAVRGMLEGEAAALAARHMTNAEFNELECVVDTSYIVGEGISARSFVSANEQFHSAIARASRNPRLEHLVISHLEECARLFHMGARVRDINPETSSDHRRIITYLRARDSENAKRAMIEHNENTRQGLLAALVSDTHAGFTL